MLLDGKPLDEALRNDVLQIDYQDKIDGVDELELTLNNWDGTTRAFKYDDTSPYDLGRTIELKLGYSDGPLTSLGKGKIESIRGAFVGDGPTTLVIAAEGARKQRKRPPRKAKPAHTLTYGRTLIQFTPNLNLSRQTERVSGGKKRRKTPKAVVTAAGSTVGLPDLRAGVNVRIEGVGERFSGVYYVTSTRHTFSSGGYVASFECERSSA